MILFVAVVAAALTVPLLGGSLGRLRSLRLRSTWTVLAALALQVLVISILPSTIPGGLARSIHLASYALAVAFLWANRSVPFLWLIGGGGLANLVAIGANGGVMPASRAALVASGRLGGLPGQDAGRFVNSGYSPHESLGFLGDIFAIPKGWPMANVFSAGDVLIVVGALLLLHSVSHSKLGTRLEFRPS